MGSATRDNPCTNLSATDQNVNGVGHGRHLQARAAFALVAPSFRNAHRARPAHDGNAR